MKTMVVGLRPEYSYPGNMQKWRENTTLYAGNHGSSLITRALLKEFGGDYIDDLSDVKSLNEKYDLCVLALSTHIHPTRDVSVYADLVEKLDMPTIAPSLGVPDYVGGVGGVPKIHPSAIRLLKAVSERSKWLGCRGPYTASILHKHGFTNALPMGCPTLYSTSNPFYTIRMPEKVSNPLIVYHRSMAGVCPQFLEAIPFLGQDFEDEAIFGNTLDNDPSLVSYIKRSYNSLDCPGRILNAIRDKGLFVQTYDEWFAEVGRHDFIFGPRIHGCISALLQGIPALVTVRDLRVKELTGFFGIPTVPIGSLKTMKLDDLIERADFSEFNTLYPIRYNNYLKFLQENGASHLLEGEAHGERFSFPESDMLSALAISQEKTSNRVALGQRIRNLVRRIPGAIALYERIAR